MEYCVLTALTFGLVLEGCAVIQCKMQIRAPLSVRREALSLSAGLLNTGMSERRNWSRMGTIL